MIGLFLLGKLAPETLAAMASDGDGWRGDTDLVDVLEGLEFPRWWGSLGATAELIERAEIAVGFKLPASYRALLQERNGGVPVRRCWLTDSPTTWADDHFEIRAILGVGGAFGIDAPAQGSSTMIDEWGYPPIGVVICDMPSGGHDAVMLDYREAHTEPAVCYIDEDRVPRRVAASFAEFVVGLVDCSQIDP